MASRSNVRYLDAWAEAERWFFLMLRLQRGTKLRKGDYQHIVFGTLCKKYTKYGSFWRPNGGCGLCPIFLKTRRSDCRDTPWEEVNDALGSGSFEELLHAVEKQYTFVVEIALNAKCKK